LRCILNSSASYIRSSTGICTTSFNITEVCILPTQCIYVFHMILTKGKQ
jgi:hypothetical protein